MHKRSLVEQCSSAYCVPNDIVVLLVACRLSVGLRRSRMSPMPLRMPWKCLPARKVMKPTSLVTFARSHVPSGILIVKRFSKRDHDNGALRIVILRTTNTGSSFVKEHQTGYHGASKKIVIGAY